MGGRLRKDGQPDMRYKSNRESASSNYVARKSAVTSETFTSSDDDSYDRNAPGPLRRDGQPDMRYAVNRKYVTERDANKVAGNKKTPDWKAPGPLRRDGQPDMRYAANKKYVAEREANKVAENDRYDRNASGPLRKDGHPDMRYAVNKNYVSENHGKIQEKIPATITKPTNSSVPLRKDGQPDMRFTCNKVEKKLNPPGPLRADGQPDMRFAANKKYVAEREANKVAENKKTAEEANKTGMVVTGKVKFGLANAYSLRKKREELEQLIAKSKLNVVAVTETWFANDSDLNDACPKGFQALHRPRIGRRGGGVAIFCQDNFEITEHSHKS
jgi:hypothetical protein